MVQRVPDVDVILTIQCHAVGSHQATLKELSKVRHELLKVRAENVSPVKQEMSVADCTKALSSYHVSTEPQEGSKVKDALHQSEQSVSGCDNVHNATLPSLLFT